MSKENAKAFVQAVLNDEELREKTANMKPEEAVPLGKEMGYDFTADELSEVMNDSKELTAEELGHAAGGSVATPPPIGFDPNTNIRREREKIFCGGIANGRKHEFVDTIEDRTVIGNWTRTYLVRTCRFCKYQIEQHITF